MNQQLKILDNDSDDKEDIIKDKEPKQKKSQKYNDITLNGKFQNMAFSGLCLAQLKNFVKKK